MIAIVFVLNPNFAPYINKYIKILQENKIIYKLIYWDRLDEKPDNNDNHIVYKDKKELSTGKLGKLSSYLRFRKFVNKELCKDYSKVLLMSTLSGLLLNRYILNKYRDKIIYDIRDYTYEKLIIFKFLENRVIKRSYLVPISSPGFVNFLPKYGNYLINHNVSLKETENHVETDHKVMGNFPIIISFVGAIRHFDIDKQVVDFFGDDSRFKIEFHGYGMSYYRLRDYVSKSGYSNITLSGYFNNDQKEILYRNTSIINNYYADSYVNKYAISNKYYDSIFYRIPIWGNPNVYLGKEIEKNDLGFSLLLDESIKDKLISAYQNFDFNRFLDTCNKLSVEIRLEEERFENMIREFLLL